MIILDFESRSRADLPAVGGRRYWEHTSSEALVVVWYDTESTDAGAWWPGQFWPHAGRVLAAHNAHGFDRFAAERYGFRPSGWVDTAQLARKAGLRGSLDALSGTKDREGSAFTKALSGVRRPSGKAGIPPEVWRKFTNEEKRERGTLRTITAEDMRRVTDYCASDVDILVESWPMLETWRDVDPEGEWLDRVVNDRGICFDSDLAKTLLAEDARLRDEAVQMCARDIGVSVEEVTLAARSPARFTRITGCPDAQAATIAACTHPLAKARKALATIGSGKLQAGLRRMHSDGRLRDNLRYYGAHTGRWSGNGMQLQNLPRPVGRFESVDIDAMVDSLAVGKLNAEDIEALIRATLTASPGNVLVAGDFSGVEARGCAWASNDVAQLEVFEKLDPYKVAAAAVFRVNYCDVTKAQRQIGKICDLALGYQGAQGAITSMAKAYGVSLEGLDVPGIIAAWRQQRSPLVLLWRECEASFRSALGGNARFAGPFEFRPGTNAVACFLPSGRPIVYNRPEVNADGMTYAGAKGAEHVYGGKLVENAVSGLCRDLLVHAAVDAERKGLPVVLTVHDEIVVDVPREAAAEAYQELIESMSRVPSWAKGFPLTASGWTGKRYRK